MEKQILSLPAQLIKGLNLGQEKALDFYPQKIFVCGMGGSGIPARILKALRPQASIFLHQSYGLPENLTGPKNLIVTISFSGNTEETLSSYQAAQKKNLKTVAITTGGKLARIALRDEALLIRIPSLGLQPRMAWGLLLGALVGLLERVGFIQDLSRELENVAQKLKPQEFKKLGQNLAQGLQGKIPLIYTSSSYEIVAHNWKIKLNENAKIPAFWNILPELCHNEMSGFTYKQKDSENFRVIILEDPQDHPRILKRGKILKELLKLRGVEVTLLELPGQGKIEKIFNGILIGDWVSLFLAQAYQVDPIPVPLVELFKNKMETP